MRPFILTLCALMLLAGCQTEPAPTNLTLPLRLLNFWEQTSGSLSLPNEIQPYQFVAQAGDAIRIRVISSRAISLMLLDSNGALLAQGTNLLEATLTTGGTYTVRVQADAATTYDIGLGYSDRPNPADYTPTPLPVTVAVPTPTPPFYARLGTIIGELVSGQNRISQFTVPEERHVYTLAASAGLILNLRMTRISGSIDPVIHLYDPDGNEVTMDDNSGGNRAAELRNIPLTSDGLYSLQAWGGGFTGQYQISHDLSDNPVAITPAVNPQPTVTPYIEPPLLPIQPALTGQPLDDHVLVLGAIERPGDFDRYPLEVSQGDVLTIGLLLAEGSSLVPTLEVYDIDGAQVIATTTLNGLALIAGLTASQTGTYTVWVNGQNNTTGGYVIGYGSGWSFQDNRRGLTLPDQVYAGELNQPGQRDSWGIDLNAGDVISAALSPLVTTLDPALQLVAPDGSLVASDDNSGGGRDSLIGSARAPVSGRYSLRVSAIGATTGSYTLIWRVVNLAPTATPAPGLIPILSVDDQVTGSAYQFYRFYAPAGIRVQITVQAAPGSGLDPVAALLAPDGTVLAEGDDTPGGLNPLIIQTLPDAGTYTVRVNGYLSSGPFSLTADQVVE